MSEIFRDILGYEGLYQVSDRGQVLSLRRAIIMKQCSTGCGYKQLTLFKNNAKKSYTIHRLVAQTFLENPNNLEQINHINGCKEDNWLSNLEWCDRSHNMKHAYKLGLIDQKGERNPSAKCSANLARQVKFMKEKLGLYALAISRRLNLNYSIVINIFYGKTWKHISAD